MKRRIYIFLILALYFCNKRAPLDKVQFLPECKDGGVPTKEGCKKGWLSPCELIEVSGGCPEGYYCDGYGCVPGIKCGDKICLPFQRCENGECVGCGEIECREDEVCIDEGVCVKRDFDHDGDGYSAELDCNDNDPEVNPGAIEVCDGIDNNCNGVRDEGFDKDGDGYNICGFGVEQLIDCNDNDPEINPGAIDLCETDPFGNLIDKDCDPDRNSCGPGRGCCPGTTGCISLMTDNENCGECGRRCKEGESCIFGECVSTRSDIVESEDGKEEVGYQGDALRIRIAWNWYRFSYWYNFGTWYDPDWFEYYWYEYDYGIVWGEDIGGAGALLFTGRHFNNCPKLRGLSCHPGWTDPWYPIVVLKITHSVPVDLDIVPSGQFGYGIVYADRIGGVKQLFFTATKMYGYFWNWAVPVTGGQKEASSPNLSYSPYYYYLGASFGLVYEREEIEGKPQIYFRRIEDWWDYWTPWTIEVKLSNDPESAHYPDIVWTPYGYGVIWIGSKTGDLFYTLIDPWGNYIIAPIRVTYGANLSTTPPSLQWNPLWEEFAVVYQAADPLNLDNEDIYFIRFDLYGNLLTDPPIRLTIDPSDQQYPDMVWGGDEYGIVFQDDRTGRNEIVFIRVSLDGREIEPSDIEDGRITDHSESGGEGRLPSIVFAYHPDFGIGFLNDSVTLCGWEGEFLCGWGEYVIVWSDSPSKDEEHRVYFVRYLKKR